MQLHNTYTLWLRGVLLMKLSSKKLYLIFFFNIALIGNTKEIVFHR